MEKRYTLTNKKSRVESKISYKGEYYEVVDSDELGLTVGTTYPAEVFVRLLDTHWIVEVPE